MARLFETLETPLPGWTTRKIKQVISSDRDPFWRVELSRLGTEPIGVQFEHESLHVAWVRAVEAATMHDGGLYEALETPAS